MTISNKNKIEIYRFFFLFVMGYSTFTVLYTSYGFILAGTFDITTLLIRLFALAMIYVMCWMFYDLIKLVKQQQ